MTFIAMKITPKIRLGSRVAEHPSNILFLKADNNYTKIFFNDGSQILSSTTLGIIEQRLRPFNFFRTNRSTVINLDRLDNFQVYSNESELLNCLDQDEICLIKLSRRRKEAFRLLLM
jgi:DNA-binding LytR/AlgR family response regulator